MPRDLLPCPFCGGKADADQPFMPFNGDDEAYVQPAAFPNQQS